MTISIRSFTSSLSARSRSAYSIAESGLWIEHGPTIIMRRFDFPSRISQISCRESMTFITASSDSGSSERIAPGLESTLRLAILILLLLFMIQFPEALVSILPSCLT